MLLIAQGSVHSLILCLELCSVAKFLRLKQLTLHHRVRLTALPKVRQLLELVRTDDRHIVHQDVGKLLGATCLDRRLQARVVICLVLLTFLELERLRLYEARSLELDRRLLDVDDAVFCAALILQARRIVARHGVLPCSKLVDEGADLVFHLSKLRLLRDVLHELLPRRLRRLPRLWEREKRTSVDFARFPGRLLHLYVHSPMKLILDLVCRAHALRRAYLERWGLPSPFP